MLLNRLLSYPIHTKQMYIVMHKESQVLFEQSTSYYISNIVYVWFGSDGRKLHLIDSVTLEKIIIKLKCFLVIKP